MPARPASSLVALAALPLGFAAVLHACSASPGDPMGFVGGSGGMGSGGATGSGGDQTITVGSGTGAGGSPCQGVHCSADLHSVVDCDGNVVMTCPDTLGCGANGDCVDPCDAAVSNASTIGCEFYSVVPGPELLTRGSCFAVLLANTWKTPVTITAERAGQMLDISGLARTPKGSGASLTYVPLGNGQLDPGQLAVLFLAQAPGGGLFFAPCPAGVTPGVNVDPAINDTGLGDAFHIKTTAPVVAYDIYPYGGAKTYVSSATLLVPTAAWGTNYMAADGWAEDSGTGGKPFLQIVAAEDGTAVTLSPTAAIVGGTGIPGTAKGQPVTYNLTRGQVLQLMQDEELAGSPITSNKPVSVWGGSSCMNIPVGTYACDSGHQQLPPVKALGHEYTAVRYRDRKQGVEESVPWTLIGAVDGTTLTYDPQPPPGAPTALMGGQMVRFSSGSAFSVKSQDEDHPFSVLGHMTGWQSITMNSIEGVGDAETVNVIPPEQWLPSYLFLTDPTYASTHLVFVRRKAKDGLFKDIDLDCYGQLGNWFPIGNGGEYQFSRLDLVVNGAPQGQCNSGVHTAKSDEPFGLTVWGWDQAVSYAYPAGMSTQPINMVVVPAVPK